MDSVNGIRPSTAEQLLVEKAAKIAGSLTVLKHTLDITARALAAKNLEFTAWSPEMAEKAATLAAPSALQDVFNPSSHLLNILQTGRAPILLRQMRHQPPELSRVDRPNQILPKVFRNAPLAEILESVDCLLMEWQAEVNMLCLLLPDHLSMVIEYLEAFDPEFLSGGQTKFSIDDVQP